MPVMVSSRDPRYLHFFNDSRLLFFTLIMYFSVLLLFISKLFVFSIGGISRSPDKTDVINIFSIDVYFMDLFVDYPVKGGLEDSVSVILFFCFIR